MHSGHAGGIRQGLQAVTGQDLKKVSDEIPYKWSDETVQLVDRVMASWKQCFPQEFNRKPRKFELLSKWKMREVYVVGARVFPLVWELKPHLDAEKRRTVDIMGELSEVQKKY